MDRGNFYEKQIVPETMEYVDKRRQVIEQGVTIAEVDRVYSDPTPILNYVLIKQGEAETFYAGTKFVIPESARQSPNKGVVVKIGPDAGDVCSEGDIVTFGRYNAEPIDIDGEIYQLVRKHDIKLVERVTYAIGRN